ncbi:hypothetical protein CSC75_05840 [Pseudoxanthomonas wuyuanensis]|nr:hypothetical protein CSC75_05840 [Pseudoxanthomonas wuyuanensis]
MTGLTQEQFTHLHDRAYEAMDQGALGEASQHFAELLQHRPDAAHYHYMRGLAHKYLMDWPTALRHNLRAIELGNGKNEAEHWNAAIAATALGQWEQARQLWKACGVRIDEGSGPIDDDFGVAVVRLNPWHGGETVFMRRIDPVRARLLNVPLPESGHRFGDIVLHDGASTGTRFDGDRQVPVFNELERLVPSGFQTFAAFVSCDSPADLKDLLAASAPGIGFAEDWTGSITYYCLRCSYGAPHKHSENADNQWQPERNLGIAAQSRLSVEKLLEDWAAKGAGRSIEGIETRELAAPEPEEGSAWWCGPEDEEDAEEGGA